MIRTLVADDHRLVRRGIKEILATGGDIEVIGECASGEEVLAALRLELPDVIILDMSMPGLSGIELIRQLGVEFASVRVLVLSMHNEGQFAARAIRVGASGYVTKDADPDILLDAIRKIAAGGRFIDPALIDSMVFERPLADPSPGETLTAREQQVLRQLVDGKSLNAIADALFLSPKTISSHKMRIMQKLGVSNNADLLRYAMRHEGAPR
jgi:DNA-binding NarL/FixJ family response regulator